MNKPKNEERLRSYDWMRNVGLAYAYKKGWNAVREAEFEDSYANAWMSQKWIPNCVILEWNTPRQELAASGEEKAGKEDQKMKNRVDEHEDRSWKSYDKNREL